MRDVSAESAGRGAKPVYLAPFGLYSRYMLLAYLRHILMVTAALMTIALTIDLWPQIALLTKDPQQEPLIILWQIVRLAALRVPDLLPPFVAFATFLGVVWSESAFTESRERTLIWNSGRSPLLCLMPALMAGLIMGAGLFLLDAYLRPAAIHVQIRERLGREGIRLDRTQSGGNHWIALPNGLLRAQIEYGPPLRLHDVTIYKLDTIGHLSEVDTAAVARPLKNDLWLLENGQYWHADIHHTGDVISTGEVEERETGFRQRIVPMTLNVLWLSNLGLSPQYLFLGDLRRLAHGQILSRDESGYRTRLQAVFGEILLTMVMAAFAALLCMHYFAYRTRWIALITVLLAGYLAHFASKAFSLMGEFDYISPILAGWLAPLLVIAGIGCVYVMIQRQRGLGRSLRDTPHF